MTKTQAELIKSLGIRDEFDAESPEEGLMAAGDMRMGFNMPNALTDKDGGHGLPPFRVRKPYLVDEWPGCPQEWPRSEGSQTSYFVPVIKGKGMWLDFNECSRAIHDVAIVISIQGVNAITGMPVEDVILEQYKEECPRHKAKFGPHRYCKQCGFRWPKQNYLSTTATPDGYLWLDGFRSGDGTVRQYILTEERLRGVAAAIVGERRVHAIGISFFLSKAQKPIQNHGMDGRYRLLDYAGPTFNQPMFFSPVATPANWSSGTGTKLECKGNGTKSLERSKGGGLCSSASISTSDSMSTQSYSLGYFSGGDVDSYSRFPKDDSSSVQRLCARGAVPDVITETQMNHTGTDEEPEQITEKQIDQGQPVAVKLEVGAGAVINQKVFDDPNDLDFWREKPEAVAVINYSDEIQVRGILARGKADVTGSKEGFLDKVPKGNKETA